MFALYQHHLLIYWLDTDVSSHLSAWEAKALNIYEQGVFLHILADTLGSAGVIVSAILMWAFGWMIADPICSIFIAILIGMSVWHLLADSVAILMQRTPKQLDHQLADCYQRVMQLEGVQGVHEQVLKKSLLSNWTFPRLLLNNLKSHHSFSTSGPSAQTITVEDWSLKCCLTVTPSTLSGMATK